MASVPEAATPFRTPSHAAARLVPVAVAGLTFLVFLPVLGNGFTNFDDPETLLDNTAYRGLGWSNIRWMFTTFHMGHYQPLPWLTYALDHAVWGMNPAGYHLTSAIFHAVNAALFYVLARRLMVLAMPRLSGRPWVLLSTAAFAALAFSVHPLRVESVAWAIERRDVVSGFFAFLMLIAYVRAAGAETRRSYRRWLTAAVALFIAAAASKSITITLLAVLWVLDVYPLRRLSDDPREWWRRPANRKVLAEKLLFLVPAVAAAIGAAIGQSHYEALASWQQHDLGSRIVQCFYGTAFYFWKTIWPAGLIAMYPLHAPLRLATPAHLASVLFVVAVSVAAVVLRRRWPALAAVWCCYLAQLSPVLGLFQNGPQVAADRYTYLACLGWAILAAGLLAAAGRRHAAAAAGLGTCIVLALAIRTVQQVRVWRNSETLWTHALSVDPNCHIAHSNLAQVYWDDGRLADFVRHSEAYLRMEPQANDVRLGLANGLMRLNRPSEAAEQLALVLARQPDNARAHNWLGALLVNAQQTDEGVRHLLRAVELDPSYAEPMQYLEDLARNYPAEPRFREALEQAKRIATATRQDPAPVQDHPFP